MIDIDWKKWSKHECWCVVGCINYAGHIVGRGVKIGDYNGHQEKETNGKRWNWNVRDQYFGVTRDNFYRANSLDCSEMTKEEYSLVIDWLIRHGYADEELYKKYS